MIINLSQHHSLLSNWVAELRDINIQGDRMRFRRNLERIGEATPASRSDWCGYDILHPPHKLERGLRFHSKRPARSLAVICPNLKEVRMKSLQRWLSLLAGLLFIAAGALAQGTTGSLNGTVSHEGTPLPGVTITISCTALQGSRVAVSNVNGDFNFPALPPGEYTVQFEMDAWRP